MAKRTRRNDRIVSGNSLAVRYPGHETQRDGGCLAILHILPTAREPACQSKEPEVILKTLPGS